jgi:hypothetical protein
MSQSGTQGGLVEIAVWCHMLSVRVHVQSTTRWGGRMHSETIGPAQFNGESTPLYHMLHIAGRGGSDGHYQLLLPISGSGNAADDAVHIS